MSMLSFDDHLDRGAQKRQQLYLGFVKPALDLGFVLVALPIALPLIGLAALFLMLEGGRPFYWQKRLGKDRRVFQMVKLRTMVPNADKILETYLRDHPEARAEWDEKQKLTKDPRITPLGSFLRKTSLDELPQLWNVFRREMSIVGPRPMMVNQRHLYAGDDYYTVRPGITGLWQVSRRNSASFSQRAEIDSIYCQTVSLKTDIKILLQTVIVMVRGTGC